MTLEAIADRVAQGGAVGDEDVSVILGSRDLISIGMMADEVRRQIHGAETTFVRVFEMHVGAVPASLPSAVAAGEFRLVGRPETAAAACDAVASARRLAGAIPLFGFSLADVAELRGSSPDVYERMKAAGLDGIAETAVDLPSSVDEVGLARAAGLHVLRLTVHAPQTDPLPLLTRVCELQRSAGGFRAFAPLARAVSVAAPTTGYDDVKVVAVARLKCREVPSIQVDWPLYGPKLAQVALTMGADDVDGIVAADPAVLGTRRSAVEEVKGNIRAAGLQAVERDGLFAILDRSGQHG